MLFEGRDEENRVKLGHGYDFASVASGAEESCHDTINMEKWKKA